MTDVSELGADFHKFLAACRDGDVASAKHALEHAGDGKAGRNTGLEDLLTYWDNSPAGSMHYAAEGGSLEIMKLILQYGDPFGYSDLQHFVVGDTEHCLEGFTALHHAAKTGSVAGIKGLLDIFPGVNINVRTESYNDNGDRTPLHFAAAEGQMGALMELVTVGADVNARSSSDGATPLFIAVENGQSAAVEYLLSIGSRCIQNSCRSPLHEACRRGHLDVVRVLMANPQSKTGQNCPEDCCNAEGLSALGYASANGHSGVVVFLLECGISENAIREAVSYATADLRPILLEAIRKI